MEVFQFFHESEDCNEVCKVDIAQIESYIESLQVVHSQPQGEKMLRRKVSKIRRVPTAQQVVAYVGPDVTVRRSMLNMERMQLRNVEPIKRRTGFQISNVNIVLLGSVDDFQFQSPPAF